MAKKTKKITTVTTVTEEVSNEKTHVICILDRSGSMASIMSDSIGGFNTFLKQQKDLPDDATITIALFDDDYEVIYKELCSFSHIDARISSYFISRIFNKDDIIYQAKIFCNLARYLWDFLIVISQYTNIKEKDINKCWEIIKP